eukprot:CAMPEP_0184752804 /NCGR_PEP_ID=MMETSP0315-20130426/43774_1 /TAXON_ID=101924 /ORGANISM="Rhodosorus marinus, Strain UTEX LB 2760" /LENGTH=354 /DNA_ID=CAMNT_0027232157 /DNA_START=766 /DNA_END=1830 /DNA_ORIENTATION=-
MTQEISMLSPAPPILFVLITALLGALMPIWLELSPMAEKYIFRYGNAVAGGVLLAAGFVHMFPDASDALDSALDWDYPLGGLLALYGCFTIFVLDRLVQSNAIQRCLPFTKPGHLEDKQNNASEALVMYMLFGALSFHSAFEGLAMGANARYADKFYAILWAIIAHKFFAALALGLSLARNAKHLSLLMRVAVAVVFSIMTPIGACLGVSLGTTYDEGSQGANLIRGSLTAFSAGIFIYVALVEIIAEEFPQRPNVEREAGQPQPPQMECLTRKGSFGLNSHSSTPLLYVMNEGWASDSNGSTDDTEAQLSSRTKMKRQGPGAMRRAEVYEAVWPRVFVFSLSATLMSVLAKYT